MSDPPRASSARRSNVIAAAIIVAVIGALLLRGQVLDGSSSDPKAPASSAGSTVGSDAGPSRLAAQLRGLQAAWGSRDEAAFVRAAGGSATALEWAHQTYSALGAVGVKQFSVCLVDVGPAPSPAADAEDVAATEVSWVPAARLGLRPSPTATAEVTLSVRAVGDVYAIEGAGASRGPLPVWLAGQVDAMSEGGATLLSIGEDGERATELAMAARGVAAVRDVLPAVVDHVVVVAPSTVQQSAELVGRPEQDLGQIAAVTTTVDGSASGRGPVYVVLNPAVFDSLDAGAAQLVLTHELTHVMTGVTARALTHWVIEGFADYVALRADPIPVTESASQVLTQVRDGRVPERLPTTADFGAARHGLGATYEAAWLVFQLLASARARTPSCDSTNRYAPAPRPLRRCGARSARRLRS